MKIDLLNPKTLLKNLLLKHLKRSKILLLKNFLRNNSNGGDIYTPFGICPLAAEKGIFVLPVDRPAVKKSTVEPSGRPPSRLIGKELCRVLAQIFNKEMKVRNNLGA